MRAQPLSLPFNLRTYPFQRGSNRFRLRRVNKRTRLTFKHILIILFWLGSELLCFSSLSFSNKLGRIKNSADSGQSQKVTGRKRD